MNKNCLFFVILFCVSGLATLLITGFSRRSVSLENKSINTALNATATEVEDVAISNFKDMLQPEELYAPFMRRRSYLIRWIRDSNFDIVKAVIKLRKSLQWRLENRIDSILKEDYSDLLRYCPYTTNGRDKEGNIVVVVPFGKWKLRKVTVKGSLSRMRRNILYILEGIARKLYVKQASGNDVLAQTVVIVDFKDISVVEHGCLHCIQIISLVLTTFENNYPENIKNFYFINVSRFAQALIDLTNPLLSPKSRKIMKIYGHNKDEWGAELLKTISPDQLPWKLSKPYRSTLSLNTNNSFMVQL